MISFHFQKICKSTERAPHTHTYPHTHSLTHTLSSSSTHDDSNNHIVFHVARALQTDLTCINAFDPQFTSIQQIFIVYLISSRPWAKYCDEYKDEEEFCSHIAHKLIELMMYVHLSLRQL